jgi:hypothetical protein
MLRRAIRELINALASFFLYFSSATGIYAFCLHRYHDLALANAAGYVLPLVLMTIFWEAGRQWFAGRALVDRQALRDP